MILYSNIRRAWCAVYSAHLGALGCVATLIGAIILIGCPANTGGGNGGGGSTPNFADATPDKISSSLSTLSLDNSDFFGRSVALAGKVLVVGADGDDDGGTDRGAVYVFTDTDNDGWTDATPDKISNALSTLSLDDSDRFGRSMALAGQVLAVGAIRDDDGGSDRGSDRGAVYVFTDTDNDGWTDATPDKISDTLTTFSLDNDDLFGTSVALAGKVLAVGANGDDDGGDARGAVYIFTDTDNDGWTDATPDKISSSLATLSLDNEDQFGTSVALAGNVLVVGAYFDDDGGRNRGAVYVFTDTDNDGWADETPDKLSDSLTTLSLDNDDLFGASVALAGNILAVGASADDDGGTDRGAVYLFIDSDNDKNWAEETPIKISDTLTTFSLDNGDSFGASVTVIGNVLVVGANGDDDGGTSRGAVYVFRP